MIISKELEKLNGCFSKYSALWTDWAQYKFNGLTETDIYIVTILKERDFKCTLDDMLMFYFKGSTIAAITQKLKHTYPEFKHWAISRFYLRLVTLSDSFNSISDSKKSQLSFGREDFFKVDAFLKSDISLLSLQKNVKDALLIFGYKTLNEMVLKSSENNFKSRTMFDKVIRFHAEIKKTKY
jgi:hypothetical protein